MPTDNHDLSLCPTQPVIPARTPDFHDKIPGPCVPDAMLTYTERTMRGLSADLDVELVEFNGETNHMHLLVAYPPTLAISVLAQRLKGRTA